jgi:LPXTG-motif cell wall-anchored protein
MAVKTLLALSVLLLVATSVPVAAQESDEDVIVEAPRQITGNADPLRLFNIPSLAVHPDDPATIAMAVGDTRNGGCGLWVSQDAGLSWTNPAPTLLPEDQPFCIQRPRGDTTYANFAPDGTLYVSLSGSSPETGHPNGPISLLVARTEDLGRTHETVTVAAADRVTLDPADYGSEGEAEEGNLWHKFSRLAVDPSDPEKLYVGWRWGLWGLDLQRPDASLPFRPYIASSDDGGVTWAESTDLLAAATGEEGYGGSAALPVVGPDGTVYAFSKESVQSPPEGQTRPPSRLLMFKSTDEGETWASSVADDGARSFDIAVPSVDPDTGDLYLVYGAREATGDDDPPSPSNVYFTMSSDDGATWSEPIDITDDDPSRTGDQYLPGISVAPNGRIDVAWYDFRNDPFYSPEGVEGMGNTVGQRYWDVYYSYSDDTGATWSPNVRITKTFVDGAEGVTFANSDTRGPMGIASSDGAAHFAWSDSRPTGRTGDAEDAYFTRARFSAASSPASATGDDSPWAWAVVGAGAALALAGLALFVGVRRSKSTVER